MSGISDNSKKSKTVLPIPYPSGLPFREVEGRESDAPESPFTAFRNAAVVSAPSVRPTIIRGLDGADGEAPLPFGRSGISIAPPIPVSPLILPSRPFAIRGLDGEDGAEGIPRNTVSSIIRDFPSAMPFFPVQNGPITFADMRDSVHFIPFYSDALKNTLSLSSAGALFTALNHAYGQLSAYHTGMISRGVFRPSANGIIDVTANWDTYYPASDTSSSRYYRPVLLFVPIGYATYQAVGVDYGSKTSVPDEESKYGNIDLSGTGASLTGGAQLGHNAYVADNSTLQLRIKAAPTSNDTGTHTFVLSYAYCNVNSGASVYGGALGASELAFQFGPKGVRIFAGIVYAANSSRFQVRLKSIVLNEGLYSVLE
jgi:hypothetical protein